MLLDNFLAYAYTYRLLLYVCMHLLADVTRLWLRQLWHNSFDAWTSTNCGQCGHTAHLMFQLPKWHVCTFIVDTHQSDKHTTLLAYVHIGYFSGTPAYTWMVTLTDYARYVLTLIKPVWRNLFWSLGHIFVSHFMEASCTAVLNALGLFLSKVSVMCKLECQIDATLRSS